MSEGWNATQQVELNFMHFAFECALYRLWCKWNNVDGPWWPGEIKQ